MSGRAFALTAAGGLTLAALSLAAAAIFDRPNLAVIGVAFVVCVLAGRERWFWRGNARGWMTMIGLLAAVIVIAFIISAASG